MTTNNTLITTQLVSNTALAEFAVAAPFIKTGARTYQNDFTQSGYKVGDTIQLRRQNRYQVGDGSVATPQPIVDNVENLTINHQYHTLITYTVADLTLKIGDFSQKYIRPAIQNIIAQMEIDIGINAELTSNFYVGTPGTPLNSFQSVDRAGVSLLNNGVNIFDDAYLAMTTNDASTLKSGLQSFFTPMLNEEIARNSALGHLSYFDMFQSQSIRRHVAGAGPRLHSSDTLTVNATVSSGNTIVLTGATASVSNYFVPGDLITIGSTATSTDGVQAVNPLTYQSTGYNMQYVIQQPADSSAGGLVSIVVSPEIIPSGSLQNITAPIASGMPVQAVASHNVNMAYPSRGLDIVCPPLYKLQVPYIAQAIDPETGLSLTITQSGDILSYQNYMRLDVLCGFTFHQQYVTRVLS